MTAAQLNSYTCFDGHRRIASGSLPSIGLAVKQAREGGATGPCWIFDDATGRTVDIDTRGAQEDVTARLASVAAVEESDQADATHPDSPDTEPRGRGRPKLGVVPREVTLLPRHWDWLATQPGGASVALRKLVEEARRASSEKDKTRKAHERAYHFMSAMAGDMPGFEEATRALFANNEAKLRELVAGWPGDVRDYAVALAFGNAGQTL